MMLPALLLMVTVIHAGTPAPGNDPFLENSVIVSSPLLYLNRSPQRRSRMSNLDERPQVPQYNSSVYDVTVEEMFFNNRNESESFNFFDLKQISVPFYVAGGVVLLLVFIILSIVFWWFVCRPKPVPRRFNPRYDGPPPKRLSKLSFRTFRYSMTGNSQLNLGRYRTSDVKMQPSVSTISAASAP